MFRWFSWSATYLCSGNLACRVALICCHIHSRLCAAWPCSCSCVMNGRLIQYSFSASCSRRLIILRFICQVTTRGRRYFPIHCFPGIPFRKSAKVKNILQPATGYKSESEINHKAVQLQMSHQEAEKYKI